MGSQSSIAYSCGSPQDIEKGLLETELEVSTNLVGCCAGGGKKCCTLFIGGVFGVHVRAKELHALNHNELIEVVVVTHNSAMHISDCLKSIAASDACALVVDNASTDETLTIIREMFPETPIFPAGGNLGYARAINLGFAKTRAEFVVLSNPDVIYDPRAIPLLVSFLRKHPDVGIAGPQQVFPNGDWQRSYGDLPGLRAGIKDAIGVTSLHNWTRRLVWPRKIDRRPKEVPYLDGGVLVARRAAFEMIGGFDELFSFYGEDSDFCARLKKSGFGVAFFPEAEVKHARGASSVQVDRSDRFLHFLAGSQAKLARKHLAPWKLPLYMWLEGAGFRRLAIIHRFLRLFVTNSRRAEFDSRIRRFEIYSRLWGEQLIDDSSAERQTL